jgi:lysophospholipase L1-like esterase
MAKNLFVSLFLLLGLGTISEQKTTVYIIGDSTAANKLTQAYPETGWGMELQPYFNATVAVDNRAVNGRSTKSFINERRWEAVLINLKANDYVLIQFGHNDEKIDKPEVGTTLMEYKANLIKYIKEAQAKQAIPVLMTPIMRRKFEKGVFEDTHMGYPDVVRKLADSLYIPLIDMHRKTERLIIDLGEIPSKKLFNHVDSGHVNYPQGKIDNTHLSPTGAKAVAHLVVEGIRESKLGLAEQLINQ